MSRGHLDAHRLRHACRRQSCLFDRRVRERSRHATRRPPPGEIPRSCANPCGACRLWSGCGDRAGLFRPALAVADCVAGRTIPCCRRPHVEGAFVPRQLPDGGPDAILSGVPVLGPLSHRHRRGRSADARSDVRRISVCVALFHHRADRAVGADGSHLPARLALAAPACSRLPPAAIIRKCRSMCRHIPSRPTW